MLMVEGTHLSGTLPRVEKPKTIHTTHTRGIIILLVRMEATFHIDSTSREWVCTIHLWFSVPVGGRERLTARDTASVGQYPYVV